MSGGACRNSGDTLWHMPFLTSWKGSGPLGQRCQALLQSRGGQTLLNVGARRLNGSRGGQTPLNVGARAFCGRGCLTPIFRGA